MKIEHTHCAGLDVHKKTVVAATIVPDGQGGLRKEVRTFGTITADLLELSDWLLSFEVTHVAMESTGEYWKPIHNILEENFEVLLVNARHIKQVPTRKTDVIERIAAVVCGCSSAIIATLHFDLRQYMRKSHYQVLQRG
jgi:transposase